MKRNLHWFFAFISSLFTVTSFAQADEAYFREGFEMGGGWPTASYTVPQYTTGSSGASFYTFGVYRTTGGTGACVTQTGGASHARFPNINSTDSAYLITPAVSFGIYRVRFYNGRTSRRFTILKANTTDPTSATWTEVSFIPATNSACDVVDVVVNDANAKMLKIVSRAGTDSDIDSLILTSVNPILPVTFTSVTAKMNNSAVNVDWNIATESGVLKYIIERSTDGKEFIEIASVMSKGNSATAVKYSIADASPAQGLNFYRVRAIDKDGSFRYSSIVKVNTTKGKLDVVVAPNPIRNGEMNIQLSSITKGSYSVRLINNMGQVVFNSKLTTEGGSLNQSFRLPAATKAGIYTLQVTGEDINLNKKVVVE